MYFRRLQEGKAVRHHIGAETEDGGFAAIKLLMFGIEHSHGRRDRYAGTLQATVGIGTSLLSHCCDALPVHGCLVVGLKHGWGLYLSSCCNLHFESDQVAR